MPGSPPCPGTSPPFIAAGAEAILRDVPDVELHLLDAGHCALEDQAVRVSQHLVGFLEQLEGGRLG